MSKLFATALSLSVLAIAGCRSIPIEIPDFPSDQLLVNQATFESALNKRIVERCIREKAAGAVPQTGPVSGSGMCGTGKTNSGIR